MFLLKIQLSTTEEIFPTQLSSHRELGEAVSAAYMAFGNSKRGVIGMYATISQGGKFLRSIRLGIAIDGFRKEGIREADAS